MSRDKGARGERELIAELREWLGDMVPDRRLSAARDGGEDLCVGNYCIEVKRAEVLRLADWWEQACKQATKRSKWPALAYRQSRQPWRIVVPMQSFYSVEIGPFRLQESATLYVCGFCFIIRESLS